MHRFGNCAS